MSTISYTQNKKIFFLKIYAFPLFPVVKENTGVKLALASPAEIPITLVKKQYLFLHLLQIKQLKSCQYNQKQQCIY